MAWIVATVILGLVFWAGLFVAGTGSRDARLGGIAASVISAFLWVGLSFFTMVHNVGEREVAIVYNFSGTIAGKKDPGVVLTWPWQHVEKEDVGILGESFDFGPDNSAVSKDQQEIFARLAVNLRLDSNEVLDLYRRVGPSWKTIIVEARVPQVFKEVTSTYATPEITANRERLKQETRQKLEAELAPYQIEVVDLFVTNLGFSDSYTKAIEEKQKQVQDALRAQARVAQVEAEARQKIAEAEGDAKSNVARARGEATANRLRRQTLTPLLVQQNAIDKLNDKVTMIVCPPGSVCIPNSPIIPANGATP
jgi:prohibitin 2